MARHSSALALFTMLLLACATAHARNLLAAPQTIAGRAIVIVKDQHGSTPQRMLAIQTAAGKRVYVQATQQQLKGITTGMQVEVTATQTTAPSAAAAAAAAPTFQAITIRASGAAFVAPLLTKEPAAAAAAAAAPAAAAATTTLSTNTLITQNVNTIVIPIAAKAADGTACPNTQLPKYSLDAVKKAMFAELNPTGVTVGSTYSKCSGQKTKLTTANSMVAAQVDLPCDSTTNGIAWTFSKCDFDDFNGWADAADQALIAQGVDLAKYKYRVYLIPPGTCGWVGLGYVGCDGSYDCRAWIGGDFWTAPQAIAHELGHNLYMGHAGATNAAGVWDEYGDASDMMGNCCSDRCPNTAHAWQLGWLSLRQLDGTTLTPGKTVSVSIYSQAVAAGVASRVGGVRVNPSWAAGAPPIFVGFRTKVGGDASLATTLAAKVHVYTSSVSNTYDPQTTDWRTPNGVVRGGSWTHPGSGLVVRVTATSTSAATVTLCRKGGAETLATCQAGLDNDCNGLVGSKDAACAKLLAAAAAKKTAATPALIRRDAV